MKLLVLNEGDKNRITLIVTVGHFKVLVEC